MIAVTGPVGPARANPAPPIAEAAAPRDRPAWFGAGQSDAAQHLLALLETSQVDGVDPRQFNLRALSRAVRRAQSSPTGAIAAGRLLDETLLRYVAAVRRVAPSSEWTIVDREAVPGDVSGPALLRQAAASGSLREFIAEMPWMHENYAGLRRALVDAEQRRDGVSSARLRLNLDRARMLPAPGPGRYVLVNSAAQRLFMVEDGKVVDWMRVVVGKASQPTPMMAAMIRYTAVNPYWNLPPDLVAERIAPNVVNQGVPYLKAQGYVILSDWSDQATRVDPKSIDWQKVLAGTTSLRMRQDPGPANAMGRMKFMFPNKAGVYLHDTPNKELLDEPARLLSAGCVRLEDAPRLARWLYGRSLTVTKGMKPEHRVDLPEPVPVYLAYLTAVPSGGQTVYYDDIYGRDRVRLKLAAR